MKFSDFLKDKVTMIAVSVVCMVMLSLYLSAMGIGVSETVLILVCWAMVLGALLTASFLRRKRYYDSLKSTLARLEQKYLISDLMEKPQLYEDRLYAEIMRQANKSMLEQVSRLRGEREEYREYIEQWIHEVKTPLSAMKLICENSKGDERRKLLAEIERTEHFIEQALYYARSENPEKDYFIRDTALEQVVQEAAIAKKQLLMASGISVSTDCPHHVCCDGKWVSFMLGQLISNSAKYGAREIRFATAEESGDTVLTVTDDGVGIGASELPRVFDMGFTGTNGRQNVKSTGVGLYLCKRLCEKLGLKISARSVKDEHFSISISFPGEEFYTDVR
jgi:signal transduction histidine kinase